MKINNQLNSKSLHLKKVQIEKSHYSKDSLKMCIYHYEKQRETDTSKNLLNFSYIVRQK